MQVLVLLLSTSLVYGAENCRKVPKQQIHQECQLEDLVIKTADLVELCKDVVTKHCKERFAPVPLVPFRSSRIVGSTSLTISGDGSGSHYNKRADVHHGLSTGRSCYDVKEKQCYNVPQEKTIKSQVCKDMVSTIYIEDCDPAVASVVATKKIEKLNEPIIITKKIEDLSDPIVITTRIEKLTATNLESSQSVVQKPAQASEARQVKLRRAPVVPAEATATPTRPPTSIKNIVFTTASTIPRESRKIAEDAAYSDIEFQVAEAKATIINVRKAVANNNIDFTDARLQIQGVLKVLNYLADKTQTLETAGVN